MHETVKYFKCDECVNHLNGGDSLCRPFEIIHEIVWCFNVSNVAKLKVARQVLNYILSNSMQENKDWIALAVNTPHSQKQFELTRRFNS